MIIGIGSDLCNIERIQNSVDRFGDRFLNRVFTDVERAKAERRPFTMAGTLAKRFAAKEALGKAFGTGIRVPVLLPAMAVLNDELGKPYFRFYGELASYVQERRLSVHLSISDERDSAVAFVVVEQAP